MRTIKVTPAPSCIVWHRWQLAKNNGFTEYFECKDCRARYSRQPDGGYQPVDVNWLSGKTNDL